VVDHQRLDTSRDSAGPGGDARRAPSGGDSQSAVVPKAIEPHRVLRFVQGQRLRALQQGTERTIEPRTLLYEIDRRVLEERIKKSE